ncbi:MAG: c-type cytochrome [Nitrospira sp.]|jgi:mono/diheme cytochrome c family protein
MKTLKRALALQVLVIALACPAHSDAREGQSLLKKRCGRCHAVSAVSKSPIGAAPNLWEKLRSYPSERLEFELAEGMGSRHPTMPQTQFTSEEIDAVQSYLADDRAEP